MYSSGFHTTASAVITLNYSIANPSASISLGGSAISGSANITASIAGKATGGEIGQNGPELFLGGEEGLEYVIPTVPGRKQRGIELWKQAGQDLGVLPISPVAAFADGGTIGKKSSSGPVWDVTGRPVSDGDGEESQSAGSSSGSSGSGGASGANVSVSVSMNPTIQINGSGSPEAIQAVLKQHIRDYADDVGDEIALKLKSIFENMPTEEAG